MSELAAQAACTSGSALKLYLSNWHSPPSWTARFAEIEKEKST